MPDAPSATIRVLIVDDIAETRENIKKLLQFEADIEVVGGARSGAEGIQLATETRPHIVLMDINMPDMDGITATEGVIEQVPFCQVVILSVQSEPDYMRRAMMAGAKDFIPKPPSGDELIKTIRFLGERAKKDEERALTGEANGVLPARAGARGDRRAGCRARSCRCTRPRAGWGAPRWRPTWPSGCIPARRRWSSSTPTCSSATSRSS